MHPVVSSMVAEIRRQELLDEAAVRRRTAARPHPRQRGALDRARTALGFGLMELGLRLVVQGRSPAVAGTGWAVRIPDRRCGHLPER